MVEGVNRILRVVAITHVKMMPGAIKSVKVGFFSP